MVEKNLLFRLFYESNSRGDISGGAIDISRSIQEMGLVEGVHYDLFPMLAIFQGGSFGMEIYNFSDGVGLSVLKGPLSSGLPDTPLAIFGYSAVGDYFKKNKKRIQRFLERNESGS